MDPQIIGTIITGLATLIGAIAAAFVTARSYIDKKLALQKEENDIAVTDYKKSNEFLEDEVGKLRDFSRNISETYKNEITDLRAKLAFLNEEVQLLRAERVDLREKYDDLHNDYEELQSEMDRVVGERDKLAARVKHLEDLLKVQQ